MIRVPCTKLPNSSLDANSGTVRKSLSVSGHSPGVLKSNPAHVTMRTPLMGEAMENKLMNPILKLFSELCVEERPWWPIQYPKTKEERRS